MLATRSAGKLRELRPLFAARGFSAIDLVEAGVPESAVEDAVEQYESFEENALAKARYFAALTGLAVAADDSGIEVRALGGRPGVRSKRWSDRPDLSGQALDDENNRQLLARLAGADDRAARYVCAAAYVGEGREVVRLGEVRGVIVREPRGGNGFGYDPYFESEELRKTFGEASLAEKATVSHRARAFSALLDAIA
ncbi:MAG TPA: non-canonical purine NTP pyrophosphatase [Gemmatimonadaceae bacterium]|nr:non-canonical purine NTP pyrophosphatase [Gemmatimonadaceae bacterium]